MTLLIDTPPGEPANGGDATIQSWLVGVINNYNATHNPDYSTAGLTLVSHSEVGGNQNSTVQNLTGIAYIVLHWGGETGNSYQAYASDGFSGNFTFNSPGQQALSGVYLFTATGGGIPGGGEGVPDGGLTIAMLGAALMGTGLLRRKLNF